jgi:hypothetical protein
MPSVIESYHHRSTRHSSVNNIRPPRRHGFTRHAPLWLMGLLALSGMPPVVVWPSAGYWATYLLPAGYCSTNHSTSFFHLLHHNSLHSIFQPPAFTTRFTSRTGSVQLEGRVSPRQFSFHNNNCRWQVNTFNN